MLLQIGKRSVPILALHQFFHTLPIIWNQVRTKLFCKIQDAGLFKKKVPAPNTNAVPVT
jgi:hypothetical protein